MWTLFMLIAMIIAHQYKKLAELFMMLLKMEKLFIGEPVTGTLIRSSKHSRFVRNSIFIKPSVGKINII
jgi:hypothetical protein